MSNPEDSGGYAMSSLQLDELWRLEMQLAKDLLGLPLRGCCASPCVWPPPLFAAMKQEDFLVLRQQIVEMWENASHLFRCDVGPHGWGLFFKKAFLTTKSVSTQKGMPIGWLVKVPGGDFLCPTAHRYLRSPCEAPVGSSYNLYLGGPISLANFDEVGRVVCKVSLSNSLSLKNKLILYKASGRKLEEGNEVLWTYNLSRNQRQDPQLLSEAAWKLDVCCSEEQSSSVAGTPESSRPSKKRKTGGRRLLQKEINVTGVKLCSYCGENIAGTNVKRHWALKHCVLLCQEMKVPFNDRDRPVCPRAFMKHLDKVDNLFLTLVRENFKIIPAFLFFKHCGVAELPSSASEDERQAVFKLFLEAGRNLFEKYQIIHLKGFSLPQDYNDLLKPAQTESNYGNVIWLDGAPSTNNFSISSYDLTEEEDAAHLEDVCQTFHHLVNGWKHA